MNRLGSPCPCTGCETRREMFERVFDDIERQHSAFGPFTEVAPMQADKELRFAWDYFRAGWNEHARSS